MPVMERIDRRVDQFLTSQNPALRALDRVGKKLFGRSAQRLGERLTFSRMIPLGPNGALSGGIRPQIKPVSPQVLMMEALGKNGGTPAVPQAGAAVVPAAAPKKTDPPSAKTVINKMLKTNGAIKALIWGLPLAGAVAAAFLVPMLSPVVLLYPATIFFGGWLTLGAIAGANLGLATLLATGANVIARRSTANSARKELNNPAVRESVAQELVAWEKAATTTKERSSLAAKRTSLFQFDPALKTAYDLVKNPPKPEPVAPAPAAAAGPGTEVLSGSAVQVIEPDFRGKTLSYHVIRSLGKGGFGLVELVRGSDGKLYCVKSIDFDERIGFLKQKKKTGAELEKELADMIVRFEQEFRIQKKFHTDETTDADPHLAPSYETNFYDLFQDYYSTERTAEQSSSRFRASFKADAVLHKKLFMINKFVAKEPDSEEAAPRLSDLLETHPFDARSVVRYFSPLMKSIAAVHEEHRAAHRDVKPDNILAPKNAAGEMRLTMIDWGIAKKVDRDTVLTAIGSVIGTQVYMPPFATYILPLEATKIEPGKATTELTELPLKGDIYSFGMVIMESVTGKNPIREINNMSNMSDQDRYALIDQLQNNPTQLAAAVPHEGLRKVLARMLSYRPEENFATILDAARALDEIKFDDPAAYDATQLSQQGRFSRPDVPLAAAKPTSLDDGLPGARVAAAPPPLPEEAALPEPDLGSLRTAKVYMAAINTILLVDGETLTKSALAKLIDDLSAVLDKYGDNNDIQIQSGVMQAKLFDLIDLQGGNA
jgi:serine/threonine protein kinase